MLRADDRCHRVRRHVRDRDARSARGRSSGAGCPDRRPRSCVSSCLVEDGEDAPNRRLDPVRPIVGLVVDFVERLAEQVQAHQGLSRRCRPSIQTTAAARRLGVGCQERVCGEPAATPPRSPRTRAARPSRRSAGPRRARPSPPHRRRNEACRPHRAAASVLPRRSSVGPRRLALEIDDHHVVLGDQHLPEVVIAVDARLDRSGRRPRADARSRPDTPRGAPEASNAMRAVVGAALPEALKRREGPSRLQPSHRRPRRAHRGRERLDGEGRIVGGRREAPDAVRPCAGPRIRT